jgi:predicted secreted protein
MSPIEITNKINGEWKDSIAGLRSWKLQCGGMYVVSAEALTAIDDAFMNNEEVSVSLSVGE